MACDQLNGSHATHPRSSLTAAQPYSRKSNPTMLDENVYYPPSKRRRARRWDVRSVIGTAFCGLVLAYLTTAAVVGILAS